MTEYQSELLAFIEQEFHNYSLMPIDNSQVKHEKKAFINGLMTAARIVGISYDDLNLIVKSTCVEPQEESDNLSIPAYIRKKNKSTAP